ncbi:MAG TPA: hypothetical protein VFV92_07230 [Candidatus Bathyarchaeia archaeon]|nr:hypothetical protein [Candidatus Bathyarchaeia archaeon]
MDWIKDVGVYLWAVLWNWGNLATGGVIIALLWLYYSVIRQSSMPRKVGIVVALLFLMFATFNAWREQYRKNNPGLRLQIDEIGPGNPIPGNPGLPSGDPQKSRNAFNCGQLGPPDRSGWD